MFKNWPDQTQTRTPSWNIVVGQPGIEPGTSVLSGLRSNRLSYWPEGEARPCLGTLTAEEWWGA